MVVTGSKRKQVLSILLESCMEEKPVKCILESMPPRRQPSNAGIKHLEDEDKPTESCCFSRENDEQLQLLHCERMQVKCAEASEKNVEGDSDIVYRHQGDKLMACLRNIITTLGEPCFDAV
ncbi:hypothetical protein CDL15_Pgr012643 [Punica granatum]|uniref:Uncharacterized protein n=1 Tax=Punica granatum TaxID=22663 RepID=A0A218WQM2_PUNGR|nr:hypothetical protein CDL15_Pgr012643 [Punica granatum]